MLSSPSSLLRILVAVGGLVASATAFAAGPAPQRWIAQSTTPFTHYTAAAALSGNAIAQDGTGFLWVGTQTGLARWDGYAFRKYVADPNTPGALPDSLIQTLHTDRRGRLWVGTSTGGLARYDAARNAFVRFPVGAGGLKAGNVTAIVGDGHDGLWVGTSGGLDHLDGDDALQPAREGGAAALALPEGGVRSIARDRHDRLWVGMQQGLFRRDAGAAAFTATPLPNGRGAEITSLLEDSAGRLWIGTRGRGAFVVDADGASPRAVREGDGVSELASDTVLCITEALPGEVWLGTYGGGIVVVDADGTTRRIRRQPNIPQGLIDQDILALFRDRSGGVWVASSNALSRAEPQQRTVLSLRSDSNRPDSLRSANVSSILARPDGLVWAGVGNDGIDILDPLRGRVGQLRADAARPRTALPKARVLGMVSGEGGEVFVGTRNGLYLAAADGRRVARIEIPGRDPTATVWSVARDGGGLLWAGGLDGLWGLDVHAPGQVRVARRLGAEAIRAARVVSLQRDGSRGLWAGTEAGLLHVDTATGAVERTPTDASDPHRLPPGWLSSMLVDRRGRLWLSSYGNGVLLLEGREADGQARFRRIGAGEGLPDAGVNQVLEDRNGDIWASTDDGLAAIDGKTFAVRRLQRPDGLDILGYWTQSGAVTPAGDLLFGGQGGLSVVRPSQPIAPAPRPPVVVTEARVGAASIPAGRFDPAHGPVARLDVPAEARGLWVEFSALDFSAPERNRYAYRLRGFDRDWIAADAAHRLASYTNLPPGDYTLELRGSNRDGVWSEPPLALPVRVLPAWYQTAWFDGLVAVVALLLVAGLVQTRTVYLRRRQRELEALVAQRTIDLQQRGEELRESQRQLEKIAYADALTGLPNRRLFADELRHQVAQAQRDGPPFALLLIDLDGFKRVNDTHGHDAGDALLVATAGRLRQAVREADRVARMGGDEFAVLLTQNPATADVDTVCRRIVAGLGEPVACHGATLQVGASIGVATCPGDGTAAEPLYKAADLALYAAKRGGRNTWRWHRAEDAAPATGRDAKIGR